MYDGFVYTFDIHQRLSQICDTFEYTFHGRQRLSQIWDGFVIPLMSQRPRQICDTFVFIFEGRQRWSEKYNSPVLAPQVQRLYAPREVDFVKLYPGRDFDNHNSPLAGWKI